MPEKINHPDHYARCVVSYEPADLTERMVHPLASAIEYLLRAGHKEGTSYKEDIAKAYWWLSRIRLDGGNDDPYDPTPKAFITPCDSFGWELLHRFGEKRRFVGMIDDAIENGGIIPEKFKEALAAIKCGAYDDKEE